ncbi:ATP-dependent DNA helicase [Rhodothermus profundi]|uniref:AAA domain-containing protein n=1 Tax=Rhodothermus profundi TaxID=633813 RepID=A0A1M6SLZ6_9BACT|nr:AAA family ATPase [Rhodothermus profundi]SHK45639.1 AAA domain-containing protein [Rhodothermus profundi]
MDKLSHEQHRALHAILKWLNDPDAAPVFILTGSAGTGKTTLLRYLVTQLSRQRIGVQLAAPTGRAARLLSALVQQPARTLHSLIYVLDRAQLLTPASGSSDAPPADPLGLRLHFQLRAANPDVRLIVVDEASMVGDIAGASELYRFGSGRLLYDLLCYTRLVPRRQDPAIRLLFVGDPAQLPPVGQSFSPALSPRYLRRRFALEAQTAHLRTVYRQQAGHPILDIATQLRDALVARRFNTFQIPAHPPSIRSISLAEALEAVAQSYRQQETVVLLCRTNALAHKLNAAIRQHLWGRDHLPLQVGDLLLVNRNAPSYNLFNGDLMRVVEVASRVEHRRIGRRGRPAVDLYFRDVVLVPHDANPSSSRIPCKILENLLESPDGQLSPDLIQALLIDFQQRHPDLRPRTQAYWLELLRDPYFNALHVRYGYALTVHKAQGGEWHRAVVLFEDWPQYRHAEFFRWAYTAVTRAQEELWVVGAPRFDAYTQLQWVPTAASPMPAEEVTLATDQAITFALPVLQEYHQRLQQALTQTGIQIGQVEPLPYSVRYYLHQGDRTARVQYYHRANGTVSQIVTLGGDDDPALARQALAIFRQVLLAPDPTDSEALPADPFLQAFLERARQCLEGTGIQLLRWEQLPYALRLHFRQEAEQVTIDFYYNRRQEWTTARPVGRLTAPALFERIRTLLQPDI